MHHVPDWDIVMVMDQDKSKTKQELSLKSSPIMNSSTLPGSIPAESAMMVFNLEVLRYVPVPNILPDGNVGPTILVATAVKISAGLDAITIMVVW
jgi:hypothetical protein